MTVHKRILLKDLEVNQANDRHGELMSEAAAIEWLLVNKTEKMKDLLEDISSKSGTILEEPLVMRKTGSDKYIVYDGNRRVTCLKLLHGLVTEDITNPLQKKIETLKAKNTEFDTYVECRVETDLDVVNDLLEYRHTPGNSGAGQLKWDGHEKENFLERTGRTNKINFAREVNRILIEGGYLASSDRIPLSNFNRLFSSKEIKRRAGVDIQDDQIQLINDREVTYGVLTRIAKDMIAGKKTLDDVWDNAKKTAYIDELEKEGLLPSAKNRLDVPELATPKDKDGGIATIAAKPQALRQRDYLLPTNLPSPEQGTMFSYKFCRLFYELQNTLRFGAHEVSISIALRTFLEILTDTYIRAHGLDNVGSLAKRIQTAFADIDKQTVMPKETRFFVGKLDTASEYFSINTLHKVMHLDFHVSESDLRSYVNNLDSYLREAISRVNSHNKTQAA